MNARHFDKKLRETRTRTSPSLCNRDSEYQTVVTYITQPVLEQLTIIVPLSTKTNTKPTSSVTNTMFVAKYKYTNDSAQKVSISGWF